MIPLLLLGAGGTARDVIEWLPVLSAAGRTYDCVGILDDDASLLGLSVGGVMVLGTLHSAGRWPNCKLANTLGGPTSFRQRAEALERAAAGDDRFETIVHPKAVISPSVTLGAGCIVYPFAFLGANVRLGRHVTVLSHCSVNHDSVIGDLSILAAHAAIAGGAVIESESYIGMGACVISGARVGQSAMVGMGSVVLSDIPDGCTVAGNPARVIRQRGS